MNHKHHQFRHCHHRNHQCHVDYNHLLFHHSITIKCGKESTLNFFQNIVNILVIIMMIYLQS